jgi:hypothetical protein
MAFLLTARKRPLQFGRTSMHDAKRSLFCLRRFQAILLCRIPKIKYVRRRERMIDLSYSLDDSDLTGYDCQK